MKRTLIAVVVLFGISISAVQAAPPYYYHPGQYGAPGRGYQTEQAPAPDQILRQGIDRLKGFLSRGGAAGEDEMEAFLNKEISPYFDSDYMSKWAGGRLYQGMNDEEKAEFSAKLKKLFFAALARNLGTYANNTPDIRIYPARAKRYSREVTVNARVTQGGGYPVRLQFRFYLGQDGWKIFDVTANGTSAVAYYRQRFGSMARGAAFPGRR